MIGAHFSKTSALLDAKATGASLAQIFISNPRGYSSPTKNDISLFDDTDLGIYVHLPYLVNFASEREDVRENSLRLLKSTDSLLNDKFLGLVVHGGQGGKLVQTPQAIDRWFNLLLGIQLKTPLLVENTAGGNSAPGRSLTDLITLVKGLRTQGIPNVGVCLDTCHAWAAGYEDLLAAYLLLQKELGRVDLLHINGSRDPLSSSRDRHSMLNDGFIPLDKISKLVKQAKLDSTPMILETPGDNNIWASEIELLKSF